MTRSRSRSRSRTGVRSDNSLSTSAPSATDLLSLDRYSSRLKEAAAFIVLKVSMGAYISTPRSVYLPNNPSTTVLDVKEKIYDEIERIPLRYQQLFFLDPSRIARVESSVISIEPLDWWRPLARYGIADGAEIRCVKWCRICRRKLCVCDDSLKWRDVMHSGSRLTFDYLDGLSDEEGVLDDCARQSSDDDLTFSSE